MPTTQSTDCPKDFFEWKPVVNDARTDSDSIWGDKIISTPRERCIDWSHRTKKQYESARRALRAYRWYHRRRETDIVERLFRQEAERWKEDTQHWSSVTRMLAHPSYLRIVGLVKLSHEKKLERLLLEELEAEPDYWFD